MIKINNNFVKRSICMLMMIASSAKAEEEIIILPIDVIGSGINEQSYISGDHLTDQLIRFNSIKSNNSGSPDWPQSDLTADPDSSFFGPLKLSLVEPK